MGTEELLTGSLVPFLSLGARFRPWVQCVSSVLTLKLSSQAYLEHLHSQNQIKPLVITLLICLPLGAHGSAVALAVSGRLDGGGALEAM